MTRTVVELVRRLRSPELGLFGQGLRYAIAGGIVACVYIVATLVFSHVAGLPFQVALALGFALAVLAHFTLQRIFVWIHHEEFALPMTSQIGRYLLAVLVQYGVTALSTATLPDALDLPTDVVYLGTAACVTTGSFLLMRSRVFHPANDER
jgi:putative flippase GtrA